MRTFNSTQSVRDYPWIRAWDRMMGSFSYWTDMQLIRARADNAPQDAVYYNQDVGLWVTLEEIESEETRTRLEGYLPW